MDLKRKKKNNNSIVIQNCKNCKQYSNHYNYLGSQILVVIAFVVIVVGDGAMVGVDADVVGVDADVVDDDRHRRHCRRHRIRHHRRHRRHRSVLHGHVRSNIVFLVRRVYDLYGGSCRPGEATSSSNHGG